MSYLGSVLLSKFDDTGIDDGINVRRVVRSLLRVEFAGEPLHDVEIGWAVQFDWVAVKEVRHHNKVAVGGELVSNQLDVVELVADDICDAMQSQCSWWSTKRREGWLTSGWHCRQARQRYRSRSRQAVTACLEAFPHA